ncbi:hypothetical protein GCM10008967_09920 [Bacillus carboniphilus]|uniref:SbsC C-terminal domain-containing protein n=1 Tax=Bacillus carboniphilus TaxID=86663 RepID=A0ABN0VZT6_9BACI
MVRFLILMIIVGTFITAAVLYFDQTSTTVTKNKERLSIDEMTTEELMTHLTDDRDDYQTYGDFIEENMRMVDFSMEQLMIALMASQNSNTGKINPDFADRYEGGINTSKAYIKAARDLKKVPPLAGDIHDTYLQALDEFEQAIDLVQSKKEFSLVSAKYNAGMDYIEETNNKMAELESFAYNLMVNGGATQGTDETSEENLDANNGEETYEEDSSSNASEEEEVSVDVNIDIESDPSATGILSYFPLEVGYNYNFAYAVDGVGEAIKIIGKHGNKYLAYGSQSGMLAFYRVYEIQDNDIFINFTATEGGELYNFIEEQSASNDFSFLDQFKTDPNYQGIPYLTWPLEKGKTFGSAEVIDVGKIIEIDGDAYETIIIRYDGENNNYTDYYLAKGYGLVRCVFLLSGMSEEPMVVDYAKF